MNEHRNRTVNDKINDNYILIGSIGDRIVDPDSKDGCFEYKDHLFLVSNIDNRFFKKTGKERNYVFSKSLTEFDEEGNLLVVDADEWFQDDSCSYWYYTYKDDSFVFESKSTYCNKTKKDKVIIIAVTDTSYYYLSVFANNSKEYKFCREGFVGRTSYSGHLIRVFGDTSSIFYSVNEKIKLQKKCNDNFMEYDPTVWQACFYKDKSFCKMI